MFKFCMNFNDRFFQSHQPLFINNTKKINYNLFILSNVHYICMFKLVKNITCKKKKKKVFTTFLWVSFK